MFPFNNHERLLVNRYTPPTQDFPRFCRISSKYIYITSLRNISSVFGLKILDSNELPFIIIYWVEIKTSTCDMLTRFKTWYKQIY